MPLYPPGDVSLKWPQQTRNPPHAPFYQQRSIVQGWIIQPGNYSALPLVAYSFCTPTHPQPCATYTKLVSPSLEFKPPPYVFHNSPHHGTLHSKIHSERIAGLCEHLLSLLFVIKILYSMVFKICSINCISQSAYTSMEKMMGFADSPGEGNMVHGKNTGPGWEDLSSHPAVITTERSLVFSETSCAHSCKSR